MPRFAGLAKDGNTPQVAAFTPQVAAFRGPRDLCCVPREYCEPAGYLESIQGVIVIEDIPKWFKVSGENRFLWYHDTPLIVKKKVT